MPESSKVYCYYSLINTVTLADIKTSPNEALVGRTCFNVLRGSGKFLLYMFLATRIAIARCWHESVIPLELVMSRLIWIVVNDRLSSILNNSQSKFEANWDPWIHYTSLFWHNGEILCTCSSLFPTHFVPPYVFPFAYSSLLLLGLSNFVRVVCDSKKLCTDTNGLLFFSHVHW